MSSLTDLTADARNKNEPQRTNNILMHIVNPPGGSSADSELVIALESFPLPEASSNVLTLGYLNEMRHYAGKTTFQGLTVVYRDFISQGAHDVLVAWRRLAYDPSNGKIGYAYAGGSTGYKRNGYAIMWGPSGGSPLRQWDLYGIWPTSLNPGTAAMDDDSYVRVQVNFVIDKAIIAASAGTAPADYQA
jgi:hypothetical protein